MPARRMLLFCAVAISIFLPVPAWSETPAVVPSIPSTTSAINSSQPLSQRVVAYDIDAKYDPKTHSLEGTETLTYHNLTGQPLDTFPFHLYLNGFQPKATWISEVRQMGTRDEDLDDWKSKFYGADEIKSFEVAGQGDLTSQLHFIQPDDSNRNDRSVVEIKLPKAVPPNGFVQFKIKFHDQFPETLARTGWKRDFLLAGQWFPKVGVWWQGAWNCHQFHATTEFFADFGVYDVRVTLPQDQVIGATGVEVSDVNNPDGTKTLTYHGDDIHDFAWTASPHYMVLDDEFHGAMGPVKLRVLMQPAHWSQAGRQARILKQSLEFFERQYGPYPYKTLTLVDPEAGSAAGGMEYPTFITGESTWWVTGGILIPEIVIEHEFGHQYWYGMVATNEFEDAWLDEGINSYSEVKAMDSFSGQNTSMVNQWGLSAGESGLQREGYLGSANLDPMAQAAWKYYSFNSYGAITYGKTAIVLLTLESIIGEETMQKAMRTYFMRYRFTHPTKEDFLKTIEEVSGKDLRGYFNQAVYGSQVLDYEVLRMDSSPVEWDNKDLKEKKGETAYTSNVWIHRRDDFIFPVDVEMKFDNEEKVREHWDGQQRWAKFTYQKKAKLESMEIDPDHKIYFDRNNFNNSRTADPHTAATWKLRNYFTFLTQLLAQVCAWFMV